MATTEQEFKEKRSPTACLALLYCPNSANHGDVKLIEYDQDHMTCPRCRALIQKVVIAQHNPEYAAQMEGGDAAPE